MKFDPLEPLLDTDYGRQWMNVDDDGNNIDVVESSIAWTLWRNNLARQMFDNWRLRYCAMSGSGASVDKNTQRRWTYEEDQLLVKLLVEMFARGKWKVESGFRSGYLTHLEKLFAASMS
ncbi:unnamed protein product [Amaranthus hypochondriacus]